MAVRNLFSGKRFISRKRMRESYWHDPVFQKEIMSNPKIKKILDRPEEQREFHNMMMEKAKKGPLREIDMANIFDKLVNRHQGKNISSEEGRGIAKEFIPDSSRRYKTSDSEVVKNDNNTAKTGNGSASAKIASPTDQATRVTPAYYARRATERQSSYHSDLNKDKGQSYFDTLKKIISRKEK